MNEEMPIGARLRTLRRWRGMTLVQLADQAGVSVSFLSMAERGLRALDRRSYITALAAALQVSETELVGGPHLGTDRLQSDPHTYIPALRGALLTNTLRISAVERARSVTELTGHLQRIEALRRRNDYIAMGKELPDILDELHFHIVNPADEATRRDSLYALIDATYCTSTICMNLNYRDLAFIAAQRGAEAADMLADPVAIGQASFPLVLNAPREKTWDRILAMAERAADTLEPHARARTGTEVLGMLTLNAAMAAAATQNAASARHWLQQAHELATRVPDSPDTNWRHFSATNVTLWDIAVGVECGQSGSYVLDLAKKVDIGKLNGLANRKAGFLADTGRGLAHDPKTRPQALQWLRQAEKAAPQYIRNNIRVREAVAVMLQQARTASLSRELRGMAARLGVPH